MAEIFGTQVMDPNGELTLNMVRSQKFLLMCHQIFNYLSYCKVNVELPLPGSITWTPELNQKLISTMLNERNAYSAHYYHNGRWWTRCSAQVYNEVCLKFSIPKYS